MRRVVLILALLTLPASVSAQRPPDRAMMRNRAMLERQIMQRFAGQIGNEIGLTAARQSRMEQWLVESNQRRRDFARETMELRRRLAEAVRSPDTSDAEFERILGELQDVRRRELEQLQAEEATLAESLSPRERAQVILGLARLQDRIRELIAERRIPQPR